MKPNCESFREMLSLRMDGRPIDASALDPHFASCAECRAWEEEIRDSRNQLKAIGRLSLPKDFAERTYRKGSAVTRKIWMIRTAAMTAAALLIGLVGGYMLRSPSAPVPAHPPRVAQYLHAVPLFVRHAAHHQGDDPSSDLERIEHEMEAIDLPGLTEEVASAPGMQDLASKMRDLIERIRAARKSSNAAASLAELQERLRTAELDVAAVAENVGVAPQPLDVSMKAPRSIFEQARLNLYAGNYEQASEMFQIVAEEDLKDDAAYWSGYTHELRGRLAEALGAYVLSTSGDWRDLETAKRIRSLIAKTGARLEDYEPSQVSVQDVQNALQRPLAVMVVVTEGGPQVHIRPVTDTDINFVLEALREQGIQPLQVGDNRVIPVDLSKVRLDPAISQRLFGGLKAPPGSLGVIPDPMFVEFDSLGLPRGEGAIRVAAVAADSAAERIGIQPGDFVVALNGEPLPRDPAEIVRTIRSRLSRLAPGDQFTVSIMRDGAEHLLQGTW